MKSNLNCLVSDCAYNNQGYCYASYIKINGYDATDFNETNCDTYNKSYSKSTSSISDTFITNSQSISCSAKNCTYNLYGGCNATHVLITQKNGKCDTFKIKH
ncbi:MAG: DUF1540 domain-containing protein [Intestinibacter sp.]